MKTALPFSGTAVPLQRGIRWGFLLLALGFFGWSARAVAQPLMWDGNEVHPTRILARLNTANQPAAATLSALGSRLTRQYDTPGLMLLDETAQPTALPGGVDARLTRLQTRIEALRNSGLFQYVEPDYIVHHCAAPNDSAFLDGTLWSLRNYGQAGGLPGADISVTNAWDITKGSTNVIVAVIDTGIRYTHQDLANQMWHNPGEIPGNDLDDDGNGYIDDVFGINAITGTGDPFDGDDHGTHCSGTIGAAANDGHPHVGVNWNVRLMGAKFLGEGGGDTGDAITCIEYTVKMGARVLNNSWGGGGYSRALFDAIKKAGDAGVLFVAAAGNYSINNDVTPFYPCSYPLDNIISVAATDRSDQLADFSHYGAKSVDLGAPGVAIFSSTSTSDTSYELFDGTSMAAPHVSGAAGLILSAYPTADLTELKGRLLLGADPIPALAGKCVSGGRLNVYRALTLAGSGVLQATVNPPSTSALLASSTQPIYVKVTDLFGVRNATVKALVTGVVTTNLTFLDNGTAPDLTANDAIYTANFYVPAATGAVTMTITASATNKVSTTNVLNYVILPPPPNDHFTNSVKVLPEGGVFSANNRFATLEPSEPIHAGVLTETASLWWTWTPNATTNAILDTTGSAIDTVVAVYSGTSLATLQPIAATNDVGTVLQGYVRFSVTNGATYRIAVASTSTNSLGSIQLRVAPGGQPDTTAPTIAVSSPVSGVTVTTNMIVVTGTSVDPLPNVSGVSEVRLSVNGAIATSANGTTSWVSPALLFPGINTIVVQSFDSAGNASTPVTLQVNYLVYSPINDIFANAIVLTNVAGADSSINTTNATKEAGEPNHAGNTGGKSAWWRFTAPADGTLRVATTNSAFDTLLGVYTGTLVSGLTSVAQNDDAYAGVPGGISYVNVTVRSNQAYSIAVDGYDGVSGQVSLQYSYTPGALVHLTVNASGGGSVSPTSMDVVSNSIVTLTATPALGYVFDSWSGDVVSVSSTINLQMSGNRSVTAQFRSAAFTDGFESGNLSGLGWATSGDLPWIVQTNFAASGGFAARSGVISANQTSSLVLAGNFRAGTASFAVRVSSEPIWDVLSFYVDDALVQQWSGAADWQPFSFPLSAGPHTLEWEYAKDGSLSEGLDAAFLDNLSLPIAVALNSSSPAHLTARQQTGGLVYLDLTGQTNQLYVVEASTNLQSWLPISTNVLSGGFARVLDSASASNRVRFYRAVSPAP